MAYWHDGHLYKTVRIGKRTTTRYLGTGQIAELLALVDATDREERLAIAAGRREIERAHRLAFQESRQAAALADRLLSHGLTVAGFWRRARHSWQRRTAMATTEVKAPAVEAKRFELAEIVETSMVVALSGKNPRIADGLESKLKSLRAELSGPDPSPALRLAVEHVCFSWLDHWTSELLATHEPGRITPALDRRRTWSARRLNQALVTCERIARLSRMRGGPRVAIQVNNFPRPSIEPANGHHDLVLNGENR
jgi:hypothetical protein